MMYIAWTPFLLKSRSANPHIKKANERKLAPRPVKAMQFGCWLLKQQNKGATPIFIYLE